MLKETKLPKKPTYHPHKPRCAAGTQDGQGELVTLNFYNRLRKKMKMKTIFIGIWKVFYKIICAFPVNLTLESKHAPYGDR